MDFKPVFQKKYCEIVLHNDSTIKIQLRGFLKIEQLIEISEFMRSFLKIHSISNLLIDHSDVKVLSREVMEYMAEMFTTVSKRNIQRIAIIEAENIFAKASFSKIDQDAPLNSSVARAYFMSERGALEWLLSPSVL